MFMLSKNDVYADIVSDLFWRFHGDTAKQNQLNLL